MTMTEEEFRSLIVRDMSAIRGELALLRRKQPSVFWGVFWGLVAYSIIGVVFTVITWGMILTAISTYGIYRAAQERIQREVQGAFQNVPPGSSQPAQPAPVQPEP